MDTIDEASRESFPTSDPPAWTLGTDHEVTAFLKKEKNEIARVLTDDHTLIKNMLYVIRSVIGAIQNNKKIDSDKLRMLSRFLSNFADLAHRQKEELLYPTLIKEPKDHPSNYLLNDLKREHEYGRKLLTNLKQLVQSDYTKNITQLLELLNEIYHFYTNHLSKEEEYILPSVNVIKTQDQEHFIKAFSVIEKKLGSKEHEELIKFAEDIAK